MFLNGFYADLRIPFNAVERMSAVFMGARLQLADVQLTAWSSEVSKASVDGFREGLRQAVDRQTLHAWYQVCGYLIGHIQLILHKLYHVIM